MEISVVLFPPKTLVILLLTSVAGWNIPRRMESSFTKASKDNQNFNTNEWGCLLANERILGEVSVIPKANIDDDLCTETRYRRTLINLIMV